MGKSAIAVVLVSAFLIAASSWAIEGDQRIVGTVESRAGQQLKVRTPEGRVIAIGLRKGTQYRKGSGGAALSDVEVGARVVVEAQRTGSRWVARSVRIEGPSGAASGQPAPADHAGHAETPPTAGEQPQHAGMAPGEPTQHAGMAPGEPMQHGGMTPGQPMQHGAMGPAQPMEHGRNLFQSDMTVMAGMTPRDPMAGMAMPHWQLMTMGAVRLLYDHQGGPSGDDAFESSNFGMVMTQRDVAGGRVTLMMMNSLEPATIPDGGSPQLFQTGETFHGNPIVDRQHAHDLFMNLSATYRGSLGTEAAYWVQAAVRGEPALGPTAFMHRASAGENPTATLGHHWQDSTHITNNVITVGAGWRWLALEGSAFHGAEPDEHRWDIEGGGLDSVSGRARADFGHGWSSQVSYGFLKHPEALQPGDLRRTTASLHYGAAGDRPLAVTLLWGRNREEHGTTDSFLGEAAYQLTELDQVYGRVERVEKPLELLLRKNLDMASHDGAEAVVPVRAFTVGYFRDVKIFENIRAGLGADLTAYGVPSDLQKVYGQSPVSVHVFARLRWNKGHGITHGGH